MSGLLIAGTSSDAGKSLVVAGLCRVLADAGHRVVPFKAQNMSNNSMVTVDGAEIGRAQYLQAQAARVPATAAMNPVLLKPGTDRRSFVVVRGAPAGTLEAGEYATGRRHLAEAAFDAYEELATGNQIVVCEGAGSPAEINLRAGDYVNFGLAQRFHLPVILVGDIDRGGVLAAIYGTWAIVSDADRQRLRGFLINKFRGDPAVLAPGLDELSARTGLRNFGVLGWLDEVWLDGEDALEVGRWRKATTPSPGRSLRVAVARLPRLSNATDVDPLAAEPGVEVIITTDPAVVAGADLAILPGTRATLDDLAWLRASGIADAITERAKRSRPVLGICGGYQMLTREISDPHGVEGAAARCAEGLGLLDAAVTFDAEKQVRQVHGSWRGLGVDGYEIHHGRVRTEAAADFLDGSHRGAVWGTLWHGAFENDAFRRAWLTQIAAESGAGWAPTSTVGFGERREQMIDRLADAIRESVHIDAIVEELA